MTNKSDFLTNELDDQLNTVSDYSLKNVEVDLKITHYSEPAESKGYDDQADSASAAISMCDDKEAEETTFGDFRPSSDILHCVDTTQSVKCFLKRRRYSTTSSVYLENTIFSPDLAQIIFWYLKDCIDIFLL